MDVQSARLMTINAAEKVANGDPDVRTAISAIKVFVPAAYHRVVDRAIQVWGGAGVSNDLPAGQMYLTARVLRLADGPDEVHKILMAKNILHRYEDGEQLELRELNLRPVGPRPPSPSGRWPGRVRRPRMDAATPVPASGAGLTPDDKEPPCPPAPSYEPGTPSWVDLASPDLAASAAFYSALFGWEAQDQGPEAGHYHMFEKDGVPVAGAGPIMMEGQPPAWTTYVSVGRRRRHHRQGQGGRGHGLRRADGRPRRGPDGRLRRPHRRGRRRLAAPPAHRRRPGQRAGRPGVERAVHPGHSPRPSPSTARSSAGRRPTVPTWAAWSTPSGSSTASRHRRHDGHARRGACRGAGLLADLLRHRRLRCHRGRGHRPRGHPGRRTRRHPRRPVRRAVRSRSAPCSR